MITGPIALLGTVVAVFGRAFQQLNVTGGHYYLAFVTPWVIAFGDIAYISAIAIDTWSVWPWIAVGGGIGSVGAMWTHKRIRKLMV